MTEISTVREDLTVGRFEGKEIEKKQKIEAPELIDQPVSAPGESEKRMKSEEIQQRAATPNLRVLDQELKSPEKRFERAKELFIAKINEFKQAGGSVQELTKEDPIAILYMEMFQIAKEATYTLANPLPHYFLELYELELETGFAPSGVELLLREQQVHLEICKKYLPSSNCKVCKGARIYRNFFWDNIFPAMMKLLQNLEKSGDSSLLKLCVSSYAKTLFDIKTHNMLSFTFDVKDPLDLLKVLLPYVVKYDFLDSVKPYFDDRNRYLPKIERVYRWIDLLCQAAEIMAPIDATKSEYYIGIAKRERDEKLWAYLFSPWRWGIEAQAKRATARIEEVVSKNTFPV